MTALLLAAVALLATLAALKPFRWAAMRFGILDRPGPRKAHLRPVPYLGGLAMLTGVAVSILLIQPQLWPLLVLLVFVAAIGLVDDIRYLPVWAKLVGEGAIAATAVALGFSWHLTDSAAINAGVSVIWMIGLTNSFNLLDNMDGLASTTAASSLIALAVIAAAASGLAAPLAGAAIGFLYINRPRAKMFMGDAGSLMLGFGVAMCSITAANSAHGLHSLVILTFPVAVGIFDTTLVIVSRLTSGRPIQLGGQDHFSHRLRLLGWSQNQVLGTVLIGSLLASLTTLLALRYPLAIAWLAIPIGLAFLAAWAGLLRVDPYASSVHSGLEVIRGG
jgi:UDP-GlcNAc:undecaprenyl-phosphate GlcNAc-1-phosphate transferase